MAVPSSGTAGLLSRNGERGWQEDVLYGELVVLGYNGCLPNVSDAGTGRLGSKFVLQRRPKANGVTPVRQHIITGSPAGSKVVDPVCHSVSYTMSRSESVLVEYGMDDSSDMFQVGRSSESPIDFIIADAPPAAASSLQPTTVPSPRLASGLNGGNHVLTSKGSAVSDIGGAPVLPLRQQNHGPKPRARSAAADDVPAASGSPSRPPPLPPRAAERRFSSSSSPVTAEARDGARQPQPRSVGREAGDAAAAARPPAPPAFAMPSRLLPATGRVALSAASMVAASSSGASPAAAAGQVQQQHPTHPPPSTISRFACRVVVSRHPPHTARLFAAGFDSNKRIVLGEKATKWCYDGEFDGLTTNGVRLLCPPSDGTCFFRPAAELQPQPHSGSLSSFRWREVSVCGRIYDTPDGSPSSSATTRVLPDTDGNVLLDGALIDLCGVTLMWRSAEGLTRTMQTNDLEGYIAEINRMRPQCPVGLNTLVLPQRTSAAAAAGWAAYSDDSNPYIYIRCGHVHGAHGWNASARPMHQEPQRGSRPASSATAEHDDTWSSHDLRTCPLCMQIGPFVKLQVGTEPSLYVDKGRPTHCFVPCAHMASEQTVKYWSAIALPFLNSSAESFRSLCPFCNCPLPSLGDKYVRVIFQEQVCT